MIRIIFSMLVGLMLLSGLTSAWATEEEDNMAKLQQQLNKEVMEKPFFAEEPEKVDAYIKEAEKNHIKPLEYTGPHWQAGYTCHDMLRYSWEEYRNCRYYHHYYGHYYAYPY